MQRLNQEKGLGNLQTQFLPVKTPRNAGDILSSETKSLAYISGQHGELKAKAILTNLIIETLDFFSVTNSMSDSQIAITVNLIMEDYSLYKPDFFILCFNNSKKGKYGKSYNRIDGQIIFEWIALCDADFTAEVEHQRINEKKRHERIDIGIPDPITSKQILLSDEHNKPVPMPEYVKETIHKLSTKNILPPREIEVTEQQKLINSYVDDFNKIFDEQDDGKGGKKFIEFDHRMMDVAEYIEYRVKFEPNNQ